MRWHREMWARGPPGRGYWELEKWGFPKIRGTLLGGPYNKDNIILGSILGSPDFGKLPNDICRYPWRFVSNSPDWARAHATANPTFQQLLSKAHVPPRRS